MRVTLIFIVVSPIFISYILISTTQNQYIISM
nr:MAG TPA: hypothetical protein [Caudoviricetes sp.]